MILPLLLCGAVAALALVAQASRPATDRSRRRAAARRVKFVEANPTHANTADVLAGLARAGVPARQAHFVSEHALGLGIRPFTLWMWLERFGAESLSLAVAADVTQAQLLTHLSNDTAPDADELRLFASANGLVLGESASPVVRHGAPSAAPTVTSERDIAA